MPTRPKKNFPPLLKKVDNKVRPDIYFVAGGITRNTYIYQYKRIISYLNNTSAFWIAVSDDQDRPLGNFVKYFGKTRKIVEAGEIRFIGLNTANRRFTKKEDKWLIAI